MQSGELVSVAQVVGVLGLAGELKVKPLSDHPRRFTEMPGQRMLWRRKDEFRRVNVRSVQTHGRYYILALDDCLSREDAEKLVGGELVVAKTEVLPLPSETYYCFQIAGLAVFNEYGEKLGLVREVLSLKSNDVYVVEGPRGDILLPALRSVVKEIDLVERRMTVTLPLGLEDDA
ncbi:MAG: Ribosome maturation factor RimM [Firmicutes bacterium]|nr:Ribosome maturation factor RimM [candidate division NPL-UPA2 bacterium]MBT9153405.1 Ribosome maturation factor RimM [candidate division NPL-UPA2 bacterium]MBT9155750.1 Ribosome maturation factor RimM [candidate division NPL-UPA2 bacterium]